MLRRKGFTLIEILVVIAITGVLVTIVMVNSGRNPDRDVRAEKDRLVTFFRDVQNKSLSAEQLPDTSDFSSCYDATETPHRFVCNICGYGIKMSDEGNLQAYYVKKADVNDSCSALLSSDGVDYEGNSFYPNKDVTVSFPDPADKILFLIPRGDIYYNGERLMGEEITVNLSKSDVTVPVTITPGGIIK
jgi:prepilin-type N-terminal cleavage/methylation domain-containing protein